MIASDLVRAVVALGFILAIGYQQTWLLYVLSALLMLASPFFTSGRSAILPSIASEEELHTANSLTQTTGWMTLAVGAYFGGTTVAQFGYQLAFVFNTVSFSVFGVLHLAAAFRAISAPRIEPERDSGRPALARIPRRLALHVASLRSSRHWLNCRGLGQRRRRGASALYAIQRAGFQPGARRARPIWGTAGVGLLIGGIIGNRSAR